MGFEKLNVEKIKQAQQKLKLWEEQQAKKEADAKLRLALWEKEQEDELKEQGHDPNWEPKSR